MTLQITYTVFPDELAKTCTQHTVDWPHLVHGMRHAREYPSKGAMPLIKLATFGELRSVGNALRHNPNMLAVHGVEGDYDGEQVTIEQAAERLTAAGIEAVLYSTPRHTPTAPRWRVLAPLHNPCEPSLRRELVGVLNAALGGILATESFTDSQSFYFGKVAGAEYEARHVAGECLDDGPCFFFEPQYLPDDHGAARPARDDFGRWETLASVTDETMSDVRSAVRALSPHRAEPGNYPLWVAVLQMLKSLEQAGRPADALALAHEFSATGAGYVAAEVDRKWQQLDPHSVTYKSLFAIAADDGWVNPRKAANDPERPDGGRVDMTDSGNANALFEETRGDLRYIVERKCWMQWGGCAWTVDESGAIARRAGLHVAERYLTLAKRMEAEAENAVGDDRKRLLKLADSFRAWAMHCRNSAGLDRMFKEAARDDRFAVSVAQLDQDRWALGVANGVVDLRTGKLRDSSRDDFITKRSPYAFKPDAQAPRWNTFSPEITGLPAPGASFTPRPDLATYLHRAIGYWATGAVNEHKMFVFSGAGSNGKSVLVDVLAEVLGPYCVLIPPDAMMSSSHSADGERPTPFARNLAGARLAFGSEAKEGQKLNAAWVKKQTGDAKLTARGLHENAFTFPVTHKLALLTNHEPRLDHMDDATRGRLHIVPFDMRWNRPGLPSRDASLPDGDKHLMQKLMAEAEGILAWIVRGAVAYARDGLEPPAEVAAKTLDYFEQQDGFSQWLHGMERCPAKDGTAAAVLFGYFGSWCVGEGIGNPSPSTPHAFGKALQALGIERARPSSGTVWGLRAGGADAF
jgi:putative DNA primase/helicase